MRAGASLVLASVWATTCAHAAPPQYNTLAPNDTALVYRNNVLGAVPIEQFIESARGIPGPGGAKGASFYAGSGAPSSLLGANGDSYVDASTGNLWQRGSGGWVTSGYVMVPVQSVFGRTGNVALLSSDIATALGSAPELQSNKGASNGYAALVTGTVPLAQLPALPTSQIAGFSAAAASAAPVQSVAGLTGSPTSSQVAAALSGTTLAPASIAFTAGAIASFSAAGIGASSATVVDSWTTSAGHSALYTIEARQASGVVQISEMLVLSDGVNVTILPFASASTGSAVAAVSASLSGTTVSLTAQAITSAVSVSGVRILLP